ARPKGSASLIAMYDEYIIAIVLAYFITGDVILNLNVIITHTIVFTKVVVINNILALGIASEYMLLDILILLYQDTSATMIVTILSISNITPKSSSLRSYI